MQPWAHSGIFPWMTDRVHASISGHFSRVLLTKVAKHQKFKLSRAYNGVKLVEGPLSQVSHSLKALCLDFWTYLCTEQSVESQKYSDRIEDHLSLLNLRPITGHTSTKWCTRIKCCNYSMDITVLLSYMCCVWGALVKCKHLKRTFLNYSFSYFLRFNKLTASKMEVA